MITVDLPWPPSLNHLYASVNGRKVLSKSGRLYRWAVLQEVNKVKPAKFESQRLSVQIDAFPPDRRKRDLDNMLKCALDGLTNAGLWEDDSQIDHLSIRRLSIGGFLRVKICEMVTDRTTAKEALDSTQ